MKTLDVTVLVGLALVAFLVWRHVAGASPDAMGGGPSSTMRQMGGGTVPVIPQISASPSIAASTINTLTRWGGR